MTDKLITIHWTEKSKITNNTIVLKQPLIRLIIKPACGNQVLLNQNTILIENRKRSGGGTLV